LFHQRQPLLDRHLEMRGPRDAIELMQVIGHDAQIHQPQAKFAKRLDVVVHAPQQYRLVQDQHTALHKGREGLRDMLVDLCRMIGMNHHDGCQARSAKPVK
jgi:hypothetical protein